MAETRHKNCVWNCTTNGIITASDAQLAVLMDIRDELQVLNNVFRCHNALAIPGILRNIEVNTRKPKRRRVRKPKA